MPSSEGSAPSHVLAGIPEGYASPSQGIASPSQGIASPSQGIASPSEGIASHPVGNASQPPSAVMTRSGRVVNRPVRAQLSEDNDRLKGLKTEVEKIVAAAQKERQVIKDKRVALQEAIRTRHDTLQALIDQYQEEALASLDEVTDDLLAAQKADLTPGEETLQQLTKLQQRVQQAVDIGAGCELVTVARDMRCGHGSEEAVQKLTTKQMTTVCRPALSYARITDTLLETMRQYMGNATKMEMDVPEPEVAMKEQFRCREDPDTDICHVCPLDNDKVWVSYAPCEARNDAEALRYNARGKVLGSQMYDVPARLTWVRIGNGCAMCPVPEEGKTCTYAKRCDTTTKSFFRLDNGLEGQATVYSRKIESDSPLKIIQKEEFTVYCAAHRAFDVDASEQLFVVLEEAQAPDLQRTVRLYRRPQPDAIDTYCPPIAFQPSDVCFYTLGGHEVLLVADKLNDAIHVVNVQDGRLSFTRYLAPGCPLLVQPTALNTDTRGRLWVASRGPVLTVRHRQARLQWAQGHLNWNNVRWQNVLFSDESRFCIDHADGRVRVWRRRGDRYADNCVVENNAWSGPSLMLWGAIGHNQVLGPVIFQVLGPGRGNGITAQRYMDQQTAVPPGGVSDFQTNFYISVEDLERARKGMFCMAHPKDDLDLFCVDCDLPVCLKCVMTKHKTHETQDLSEAAEGAMSQLDKDRKRLQSCVWDVQKHVQLVTQEQQAVKDKHAALVANIRNRQATLKAAVDKYTDDALASLHNITTDITDTHKADLHCLQQNLQQLTKLQQRVQQAVDSGAGCELVTVAREMRCGRGSEEAVQKLTTKQMTTVCRPVLRFSATLDATLERMRDYMGSAAKMEMAVSAPEVTVMEQFRCREDPDTDVYHVCPMTDGDVEQLFVVLEEAQAPDLQRTVRLYRRPQPDAIATYSPPVAPFQPSDVCFYTLGGHEVLLVADELNDAIHVVNVQDEHLSFARYLAPGCPLLVQPTALNTDTRGRLWIAFPQDGVFAFKNNFYMKPEELQRARDGSYCSKHPKKEIELYCVDCDVLMCVTCLVTKHNQHKAEDISEATERFKTQLDKDIERLERCVGDVQKHVQLVTQEQQAVKDKHAALVANIRNRQATLKAAVDKYTDDALASLHNITTDITDTHKADLHCLQQNLQQLTKLQQRVQQAVDSGAGCELVTVAREMRCGRGSEEAVQKLTTKQMTTVCRPVLRFSATLDATLKHMRDYMGSAAKMEMAVSAPEVTVMEQFRCRDYPDTDVYHVCPMTNDEADAIATYSPPVAPFQPSDVCFYTLGGHEVLLVADELNDAIHVVNVQDGRLSFARYLAPGCPLLGQPTALNTDTRGRLWVACPELDQTVMSPC
nr:hypothetical protein BaRGS_016384 [Batillaria attramentaria]